MASNPNLRKSPEIRYFLALGFIFLTSRLPSQRALRRLNCSLFYRVGLWKHIQQLIGLRKHINKLSPLLYISKLEFTHDMADGHWVPLSQKFRFVSQVLYRISTSIPYLTRRDAKVNPLIRMIPFSSAFSLALSENSSVRLITIRMAFFSGICSSIFTS